MIDNNPSKSVKSVVSDMGVSEFLIRQVVHEDIQYSLYKMRKGKFLSLVKKTTGKTALQSFQEKKSPLPEHALGLDGELT